MPPTSFHETFNGLFQTLGTSDWYCLAGWLTHFVKAAGVARLYAKCSLVSVAWCTRFWHDWDRTPTLSVFSARDYYYERSYLTQKPQSFPYCNQVDFGAKTCESGLKWNQVKIKHICKWKKRPNGTLTSVYCLKNLQCHYCRSNFVLPTFCVSEPVPLSFSCQYSYILHPFAFRLYCWHLRNWSSTCCWAHC